MRDETLYEVLGVDSDADAEAIEDAYREKVKEYHPDVSDQPDARERFEDINRAREVLTDGAERARYDRLGHEGYLRRERRGRTDRDGGGAGEPAAQHPGGGADGRERTGDSRHATSSTAGATGARANARHGQAGGASERPGTGGRAAGSDRASGRAGTGDRAGPGATGARNERAGERTRRRDADAAPGQASGSFLLREALSALALVAVGGCAVVLAAVVGDVVTGVTSERLLLVACWSVVAVLAGQLAAGSALTLPDDVVRAHALPLVLFVAAWYLRQAEGEWVAPVVGGLLAYGAFAALFRTAALVGRHSGSTLRPALLWFLGTAPAVLVLSASRVAVAGRVGPVPVTELGTGVGNLPPASAVAVALGAPVAVSLGYAFWRLGRALA